MANEVRESIEAQTKLAAAMPLAQRALELLDALRAEVSERLPEKYRFMWSRHAAYPAKRWKKRWQRSGHDYYPDGQTFSLEEHRAFAARLREIDGLLTEVCKVGPVAKHWPKEFAKRLQWECGPRELAPGGLWFTQEWLEGLSWRQRGASRWGKRFGLRRRIEDPKGEWVAYY